MYETRYFAGLSAGKHNEQVEFIAVPNRRGEFMRVNAGMIYQNFHEVEQFVISGKQGFLHFRKLPDEVFQAFAHGIPLHGYRFPAAGKLPMRCVDMYGNSHVSCLFRGYPPASHCPGDEFR